MPDQYSATVGLSFPVRSWGSLTTPLRRRGLPTTTPGSSVSWPRRRTTSRPWAKARDVLAHICMQYFKLPPPLPDNQRRKYVHQASSLRTVTSRRTPSHYEARAKRQHLGDHSKAFTYTLPRHGKQPVCRVCGGLDHQLLEGPDLSTQQTQLNLTWQVTPSANLSTQLVAALAKRVALCNSWPTCKRLKRKLKHWLRLKTNNFLSDALQEAYGVNQEDQRL